MPQSLTSQAIIDKEFADLTGSQANRVHYKRLSTASDISRQVRPHSLVPGYRIVRMEHDAYRFEVALLCDTTGTVEYYVSCEVLQGLRFSQRPVTQTKVWRTTDIAHRVVTQGLADDVFRNYLLKRYSIVASDSAHTYEGRQFWVVRMRMALDEGLYVYRYDRQTGVLDPLLDPESISTNSADLWGDSPRYQDILAIISLDML